MKKLIIALAIFGLFLFSGCTSNTTANIEKELTPQHTPPTTYVLENFYYQDEVILANGSIVTCIRRLGGTASPISCDFEHIK